MSNWFDLIGGAISTMGQGIIDTIRELVRDKDLAAKLETQIKQQMLSIELNIRTQMLDLQKFLIEKETQSSSAFYRNWRPLLMYVLAGILALYGLNNIFLFPVMTSLFKLSWPLCVMDWQLVATVCAMAGVYVMTNPKGKT